MLSLKSIQPSVTDLRRFYC